MGEWQEEKKAQIKRKQDFLIQTAFVAVWVLIIWSLLKAAGSILLPFVLAFLIAWILAWPVDKISEKLHWRRKIVAVVTVILFYGLISCLIYFVGNRLLLLCYDSIQQIAVYVTKTVMPALQRFSAEAESGVEMITKVSEKGVERISTIMTGIPGFCMQTLIMVIATVFAELDFHEVISFLKRQIPEKYKVLYHNGNKYLKETVWKCVRAYVLIFGLTFFELLAGFLLLKIKGAVMIAFFVSILDILPILGTGTILVPWGIIAFMTGDVGMGTGILCLYLFITVIRNIIEPKLVGKQMGLPPVVMLPCMLLGLKLFGIIGLFGVPFGIAVLKCLDDQGIIHIIKHQ